MIKHITFLTTLALILTGCASAPKVATVYPLPRPATGGIYHRISGGETLWRIGKSYNVEISKIARVNRLKDPSKIVTGQLLFIPGVKEKIRISAQTSTAVSKTEFIWPVKGNKIVSYFGQKSHNTVNRGIDILSYEGASVVASKNGVVSFCGDKVKGFGRTIIVDHDDGYSTVYAYNSQNLVKPGDRVNRSQVIAKVGKSSRSDKHTLHFEIRKRQKPKNPFYYLP